MEGEKEQEDATGENGVGDIMDAVKYLKELDRMCTKSHTCDDCPIYKATKRNCGMAYSNAEMLAGHVGIVEQWAKEHPPRTRQDDFLGKHPNAKIEHGVLYVCPKWIEGGNCADFHKGIPEACPGCKKRYWGEKILDDD